MIELLISHALKLTLLAGLTLLLRHLARHALSPRQRYILWLPLLIRALLPVDILPGTIASLPSLVPPASDTNPAVRHLILAIYSAGLLLGLIRLCLSQRALTRLRRDRQPLELAGIEYPVYVSDRVSNACLVSDLKGYVIYIHPALLTDARKLQHILQHETAHARQLDPIWNRLRAVALVLHWHNPLLHYCASWAILDSECAADDRAISTLGNGGQLAYAHTLFDLVTDSGICRAQPLSSASSLQVNRTEMRTRLLSIAQPTVRAAWQARTAAVILSLALILSLAAGRAIDDGSRQDAVLPPNMNPLIDISGR